MKAVGEASPATTAEQHLRRRFVSSATSLKPCGRSSSVRSVKRCCRSKSSLQVQAVKSWNTSSSTPRRLTRSNTIATFARSSVMISWVGMTASLKVACTLSISIACDSGSPLVAWRYAVTSKKVLIGKCRVGSTEALLLAPETGSLEGRPLHPYQSICASTSHHLEPGGRFERPRIWT